MISYNLSPACSKSDLPPGDEDVCGFLTPSSNQCKSPALIDASQATSQGMTASVYRSHTLPPDALFFSQVIGLIPRIDLVSQDSTVSDTGDGYMCDTEYHSDIVSYGCGGVGRRLRTFRKA